MEKLAAIVKKLEGEYDTAEQIKLIQELGKLLITDYAVKVNDLIIEPLWIEGYYFHKGKFEDINCHRKTHQTDNFGRLYLHTNKKISPSNRMGGADIVLSMGDYCLSFLVKNSLCRGKFCKQVELNAVLCGMEYPTENSGNVLVELKRNHRAFCTERIGLTKESFRDENLAVMPIDMLKSYPFKFKEKIAFEYMEEYRKNHCEADCIEEYRNILGYVPKRLLQG